MWAVRGGARATSGRRCHPLPAARSAGRFLRRSPRPARRPADVAAIEAGTLGPEESVLLGSRDALHVWLTPVRALEPVPGRVHLDVRLDVDGDLDRLIALGATRQWEDPKGRWTALAYPEGNPICRNHPA